MPKATTKTKGKTKASDTRSFEAQLWESCEAQRGSVNASRYKHPVLGLVFLKYVNDNFDSYRAELAIKLADPGDEYYLEDEADRESVLEDRDEYLGHSVFWIPTEARWSEICDNAAQPDIATRIDMVREHHELARRKDRSSRCRPTTAHTPEIMDSRITSLPYQLDVPLTLPDVVIDPVMLTDAHVKNTVKNDTMVADSKMTKDRGVPPVDEVSSKVLMRHRNARCPVVHAIVRECAEKLRASPYDPDREKQRR